MPAETPPSQRAGRLCNTLADGTRFRFSVPFHKYDRSRRRFNVGIGRCDRRAAIRPLAIQDSASALRSQA